MDHNDSPDYSVTDSHDNDEEELVWNILSSSELRNWQQVEIEVDLGNIATTESGKDLKTDSKQSKTSNEDEEFQKLKEKLHVASQKYNAESTMKIRFLEPLQIRLSSDCNKNFALSPQVR